MRATISNGRWRLNTLTASIHTRSIHRAQEFIDKAQAGVVVVNAGTFGSEPHMPFGGMKQSGFGKDMSDYSFDEYTQIKHVMVELTGVAEKGWHYQIWGDAPEG